MFFLGEKELTDENDFGLLLNGSASIRVQTKESMNAMTLCLWTSVNNSSPITLSISIKNTAMNRSVTLARIANITRYINTNLHFIKCKQLTVRGTVTTFLDINSIKMTT
jgi:hypothetical protein